MRREVDEACHSLREGSIRVSVKVVGDKKAVKGSRCSFVRAATH